MNKRGLGYFKLFLILLVGVFAWLVYSGTRDFLVDKFGLSPISTILLGLIGIVGVSLVFRYRGLLI